MGETKHTPEPWEEDGWNILSPDGRILATVRYTEEDLHAEECEALANLGLMTAAPELLAACRAALRCLVYHAERTTLDVSAEIDQLQDAIAKATEAPLE